MKKAPTTATKPSEGKMLANKASKNQKNQTSIILSNSELIVKIQKDSKYK